MHRFVRFGLHLGAHALEAAAARFQVGDPDHVLVAHPQREKARGFDGECVAFGGGRPGALACASALHARVQFRDRLEPVEIQGGIVAVLEVGDARHALFEHLVDFGGEGLAHALGQGTRLRLGGTRLRVGFDACRC